MKKEIVTAVSVFLLVCAAACSKKVPVAASTPPTPAVATPKPAPTPARTPTAAGTRLAPQRRTETRHASNGKLPSDVRATLNERLARLEDALFDFDRYTIRSDASTALRDDVNVIRGILVNYSKQKLLIEGHADERGSDEYNLALGDKRARAAEEFLASMGISKDQLTVISYGKERPVCTDESEGCWQRNRRAHITAAP